KWSSTKTRIADERLRLFGPWSIVPTSADTVTFSRLAISRNASQNWSSSDTLDLCPLRMIERLMTGELIARWPGSRTSETGVADGAIDFGISHILFAAAGI